MSVDTALQSTRTGRSERIVLDVVVPVFDEEDDLEPSVRRLHAHLAVQFPYRFRITIADNASTDATPAIAARLAAELPAVTSVRLEQKGRGRALRATWAASDAQVLAYCDVDLSTDLAALLPLVAPLISGHSDIAIGTRLGRGSRVVRGPKRELVSRAYNLLLRGALAARFTDAQCGFKAIRADVARRLLPLVEDTGWFFDTELLVLAERCGLRIHEVAVDWVDDPHSSVDILATAVADLKGIARLGHALTTGRLPLHELRGSLGRGALPVPDVAGVPRGLPGQLVRFAAIGVVSTLAYLVLYALLRGAAGPYGANVGALVVTAVANTAANRRLTFGVRGVTGAGTHHVQGLIVFALGLALTTGALTALHAWAPDAGRSVELTVLVAANALATVLRFVAYRSWIFRRQRAGDAPRQETPA
ncbi:bifunctional glycosyltransferase family 2/GtrA family protein [Pseudonocardia nigra]|uniref:bifunctional glycosyltransferase family 2/GtrA family protein n=1 Tax=Pseudonocardia nigra TaxID=1921578 RepID=UPI001C5EEC60|nr:bifunctional glycosyltransferase family 2/GtrA family protein [Pseudonocardia nigra]